MKQPSTIGPYDIVAPLGGGAMGALMRGRHQETGEVVAVKSVGTTVKVNLRSLRREIRALRALEHPNVVSIIDSDVEAVPPWYAMELIDGLPLVRHWRSKSPPERWVHYMSVFADICDGLAFMHGMGLVHRDLKPGNVVIRAAAGEGPGEAVLVDFGLATAAGGGIGREQLYKRSEVIGTPSYISPEQVRQQYVDGRADLYALGCMLFELVVGETPFPADVPFTGMMHHLRKTPAIPVEIERRLPPPLIELIYALLEKSPGDRPGYASDVREVLGQLVELPSRPGRPHARTHLHRAELSGRESLLTDLDQIASSFDAGEGGVVVVHGRAGVGKSRVAIELIQRLHNACGDRLDVMVSESVRKVAASPLGALQSVFEEIADECIERGERYTRTLLGPQGALIGRHIRALANVPGVDELVTEDPTRVEAATVDALTVILSRRAQHRRLVIALDDVQWADALTRRWLRQLLLQRPWAEAPIMFVLVWRDDEGDELLDEFVNAPDVRSLSVPAVDRESVSRLVHSMTTVNAVPPPFLEAVWRDTRGLPSRVVQWLDSCVSRGLLVRENAEWHFEGRPLEEIALGSTVALNVSLDDLLARRVAGLEKAERGLVDFAAIIGPVVRAGVVGKLSEAEVEMLDQLVADGIFVDAGRGDIRFATTELYDIVVARLAERRTKELHVRAAAILESLDAPILDVALHLAESGWRDEARQRLWVAAEAAFEAGDWTEGGALLDELGRLGYSSEATEVRGRAMRAKLWLRSGHPDRARAEPEAVGGMEAATESPAAAAEIAFARGIVERSTGSVDAAVSALRLARSCYVEAGDWDGERDSLVEMGNCHCRQGDFERGRELFTAVHDEARRRDDQPGIATALASIGATLISSRRYDAASDFLRRAADSFDELGMQHRRADVLQNLGVCEGDRGHFREAVAALGEVLRIREDAGDVRSAASVRSMLGHTLLRSGDVEGAIEQLEASLPMLRQSQNLARLALAEKTLGEAYSSRKEFQDAMDHFVEALNVGRELPFATQTPYVYIEMAKLHRRLGLYADASHYLAKSESRRGDQYLEVLRKLERGYLELAESGAASISSEELSRQVEAMQLPETSALHVEVANFIDSIRAEGADREHGEIRTNLPAAFRG